MKKKFFLLLIISIINDAYAVTSIRCKKRTSNDKVDNLTSNTLKILSKYYRQAKPKKISTQLPWSSPGVEQVKSAPCKSTKPPSLEQMKAIIAQKINTNDSTSQNANVNGVSFENESPAMILAFKKLTTAFDSFGVRESPSNQKNIQDLYKINPACSKVECAIEKIWGEEMGTKILYLNLRHGFNASELAFNNSSRFEKEELDDVLLSLEDMPSSLVPIGTGNQRLTHFARGYMPLGSNPKDAANSTLMLFDTWSKQNPQTREYLLFHEMSHNVATKIDKIDEKSAWLEKSQWTKNGNQWSHGNTCFPTRYSAIDPAEDFAETMASYRYNANFLKTTCPAKYNYVKENVFKNIEYTSTKACSGASALSSPPIPPILKKEIALKENTPVPLTPPIPQIKKEQRPVIEITPLPDAPPIIMEEIPVPLKKDPPAVQEIKPPTPLAPEVPPVQEVKPPTPPAPEVPPVQEVKPPTPSAPELPPVSPQTEEKLPIKKDNNPTVELQDSLIRLEKALEKNKEPEDVIESEAPTTTSSNQLSEKEKAELYEELDQEIQNLRRNP